MMSFDPFDQSMRRVLEDLRERQGVTGSFPDAVQQFQREFEARQEFQRQLEDRWEIVRRIEERQELIRQVEERRAVLRAIEERQDLYRRVEQGHEVVALNDLFLRNRSVIDSYVYGTFYGGGASSVGLAYRLDSFREAHEQLAECYARVSDLRGSDEGAKIPLDIQAMSTVEAFASAEVVDELGTEPDSAEDEDEAEERQERRSLRHEIQTDSHQQLLPALEALEPGLVKMWKGGLLAISSTNPDRERHFTVSLREVATQVLHRLAPDDEIRKWSSDPAVYDSGKPTRAGRMRYICRSIDQPDFQEFVGVDYKALLETFDLFHKGTHAVESGLTKEQIEALETRTARALLFLLTIGNRGN